MLSLLREINRIIRAPKSGIIPNIVATAQFLSKAQHEASPVDEKDRPAFSAAALCKNITFSHVEQTVRSKDECMMLIWLHIADRITGCLKPWGAI